MSKLDELLDYYYDDIIEGEELIGTMQRLYKQQHKDLMLELIDSTSDSYSDMTQRKMIDKDELRQKVEQL